MNEKMPATKSRILVIGCASSDLVHLEQKSISIQSNGGAGLYTALAVIAAGADCSLLGPKPEDISALGLKCLKQLHWLGPTAREGEYPYLEIVHHGDDRATLCKASWGIEPELTPAFLPSNLSDYRIVHIAALSSAERQLDFLKATKEKSTCKISVGTYARIARNETAIVRQLYELCDYMFMNENEAGMIFDDASFPMKPRKDQIICITRGRRGALILAGTQEIELAGKDIIEYDPTGAGDTFAGTMLATLSQGQPLQEAAGLAIERSALVITEAGPLAISALIC